MSKLKNPKDIHPKHVLSSIDLIIGITLTVLRKHVLLLKIVGVASYCKYQL